MREIKFRGKHLEPGGTWKYGSLVVCENGDCLIGTCKEYGPEARYMRNEVYPDSVGQYTGLKDRNGKEIYEGDILLRELYSSRDNSLFLKACFVVEFGEEGGFDMIKQYEQRDYKKWKKEYEKDKKYKQPLGSNFGVKLSEVKVIGNIYENPELIEVIE